MALDTFREVYGRVLLRCPMAPPLLAIDWIRNAYRRLSEKRLWSYLTGYGQFLFAAPTTAGSVTLTRNSNQVIGDATAAAAWTAALVGQQFRIGTTTPLYDITDVTTTTLANDTLVLGAVWGGASASAQGYQVYNAYQTVPADFLKFQTVVDPTMNWQLWANKWDQNVLNQWDAQRAAAGNTYAVVFRDFDPTGITSPPSARYEFWPHVQQQYLIPYLYVKRATDISDSGATIPRLIRGDVLVEGALADCARWPGPSPSQPNPYYSINLSREHEGKFQMLTSELERQDDEIFEQDATYQMFTSGLPWAPYPADARFLQNHLIPSMYASGVY